MIAFIKIVFQLSPPNKNPNVFFLIHTVSVKSSRPEVFLEIRGTKIWKNPKVRKFN